MAFALRFCRACGFDLRASSGRCPDCGRAFNLDDQRTFARRKPHPIARRFFRSIALLGLAIVLTAIGVGWWVRHGWLDELADLRHGVGTAPLDFNVTTAPLDAALRRRLPDRFGVYLDRVVDLECYSEVTDHDLATIAGFSRLRSLSMGSSQATDAGFAHLGNLTRLERLFISTTHLSDDGLSHFSKLQHMQDLTIEGGTITSAGLAHLDHIAALRTLTICQNRVDRDGLLRWLRRHPGVRGIDGPDGAIRAPASAP